MRISSQSFSNSIMLNFNRNNGKLFAVQNKISLQTRILKPSDDPIASSQLAKLRREQSAINQYQTNIQRLSGNLATQESSIKGCEQQLLVMKDKLQEAMGGTLSAEEISAYGKELESMLEATVTLVNTRDEDGRYLFSGTKTGQQPVVFDEESKTWSYRGNDDTASTLVSSGQEIQVTTALAAAFGDDLTMLNTLQDVATKMQDGTLAPADYFGDMQAAFNAIEETHGKVGALYTELGGRQNRLSLLKDIHDDNNVVTDTVMRSLTQLDMYEASIELSSLYNATVGAQKSYTKIQQLSLFSLI
ncbi:flagellar hook-associated protein FlgL [Pantoea coffeiphila]|uniref:Flagellar hook-associated protein 3 n=1 Tax=Pantoea coffeiphila TaxID=1465635 RepID=A0A2S9IHT9_9GAMM|nr:flagellar hook-associated protein FlgL [Pantoea coffeiphila]PRD17352.1 flagellar hook-associated protein 3 [Pantoea coffeiphila]